jgi:hypothetical protein
MIAMIITFRKSNNISLEHQVCTYGSGRGGGKKKLPSPLLNFLLCSLPTGTDWIPQGIDTVTKILIRLQVMTFVYQHITTNTQLKISPPKLQERGEHIVQDKTAMKDDILYSAYMYLLGTAVARWLRYCATNRKVAGLIPSGVTGIFHWHNPSNRTVALGSTQPVHKADNLTTILCHCHVIWEP